ncbi:MAG: CHAT domain-containing protein [Thermodesulfobacteriota bacterium]
MGPGVRGVRLFALAVCLAGAAAPGLAAERGPIPVPELPAVAAARDRDAAQRAFRNGDFEQAAVLYGTLAEDLDPEGQAGALFEALLLEAQSLMAGGHGHRAAAVLARAQQVAPAVGDRADLRAEAALARLAYLMGDFASAHSHFHRCLPAVDNGDLPPATGAAVLFAFGQLLVAEQDHQGAKEILRRSLALPAADPALPLRTEMLLVQLRLRQQEKIDALSSLADLQGRVLALVDGHDKAVLLLSCGLLAQELRAAPAGPVQDRGLVLLAHDGFQEAVQVAERIRDFRARALGLGYLAGLYEQEGRQEEALTLNGQALFIAQEHDLREQLFRLHWQRGRLHGTVGRLDEAIRACQLAVDAVSRIQQDLATDCRRRGGLSYQQAVEPIYFQLADLLLRRAAGIPDPQGRQADLLAARDTLERMKEMELKDYFQDECLAAGKQTIMTLEQVPGRTAVIYPVMLPDRLVLLVSVGASMEQYVVAVGHDTLVEWITNLRHKLQTPGSRFLRYANRLHEWLLAPMEADLQGRGVQTLVFVPDRELRTIPMAALHDGSSFLIERYAVATTPSLTLTDPRTLKVAEAQVLLGGLTEAVQGFPALPAVAGEATTVAATFPATVYLDQIFTAATVQDAMQQAPYSIVHIASHGQFDRDFSKTFLLTYSDRLTLAGLESLMEPGRERRQPVELLTLSACQTAVGDERAALGLAGVAVKSGARSALASLWLINDQAAAALVDAFYREMRQGNGISKAEALKRAQVRLLSRPEYGHPAFWAPYLLIGNWL